MKIGDMVRMRKIHPDIQFQPLRDSGAYRFGTKDCGEINAGEFGLVLEVYRDEQGGTIGTVRIITQRGSSGWIATDYVEVME